MKRGSSVRLTEVPRTSTAIVLSPSALGLRRRGGGRSRLHRSRRFADRRDDVLVAGASTVVALQRVADLAVGGIRVAGEEVGRDHDHSRGAEAALEAVLLPERVLEWMEAAVRSHPLDRGHATAVGLNGQHRATLHGLAVDVDGARSTLARVAADVRSREVELLPEELHQESSRLHLRLSSLAVHRQRDLLGHVEPPSPASARWTPDAGTVAIRNQGRIAPRGRLIPRSDAFRWSRDDGSPGSALRTSSARTAARRHIFPE